MKVDIGIVDDYIAEPSGETRMVRKPVLKYKISSTVPVKDCLDGKENADMELVYDEELGRYVLRRVSEGRQMSIFDPEYEDVIDVDEDEDAPERAEALTGTGDVPLLGIDITGIYGDDREGGGYSE